MSEVNPLEEPFPLEGRAEDILSAGASESYTDTMSRESYLQLLENVVRDAVEWQDEQGGIIDPFAGSESATCTSRFVGSVGSLIAAGRGKDLIEPFIKAMDFCFKDIHRSINNDSPLRGSDFYTKELVWGYWAVENLVESAIRERWLDELRFDPYRLYLDLSTKREAVHNVNIYAIAGEFMRYRAGLTDSPDFVEEHLPLHFGYFTPYGMYRDPGDPITYDLTVRQNLSLMLWLGYDGQYREVIDELLRRGGLTTLLYISPLGLAPFGGRSNQWHHMEGMIACFAEYEARRYAKLGNIRLAGAFKRLAHYAAIGAQRWLGQKPYRPTKHHFPPHLCHGDDERGSLHSTYGLLGGNLFGMAWHMADDAKTIVERELPGELSGIIVSLTGAFHKVLATCGNYHVQIDLGADLQRDATGLGRIHRVGIPAETALSMSFTANPVHLLAFGTPPHPAAAGPAWQTSDGSWHYLAEYTSPQLSTKVNVHEETKEHVRWDVEYYGDLDGVERIIENYDLSSHGLLIHATLYGDQIRARMMIPLILTDGEAKSVFEHQTYGVALKYRGAVYRVQWDESLGYGFGFELDGSTSSPIEIANRNGLYRLGYVQTIGNEISVRFRLLPE